MSHPSNSLLDEQIGLLVRHFGVRRVRAALAKFSIEGNKEAPAAIRKSASVYPKPNKTVGIGTLELIREIDPEKHRLLSEFLVRLNNRMVLPESQDIRQFAQLVGLKDIQGKSRKDLIPKLMRFLIERATERLRVDIQRADNISQQQRQEGFSVLTDKLLGQR